jgi:hypothetical protein
MTPLPELLMGAIAAEYPGVLAAKSQKEDTPTDTCGSDCSDGGECQDSTCSQQKTTKKKSDQSKAMKRKKAFVPVAPGWNEPPASYC